MLEGVISPNVTLFAVRVGHHRVWCCVGKRYLSEDFIVGRGLVDGFAIVARVVGVVGDDVATVKVSGQNEGVLL